MKVGLLKKFLLSLSSSVGNVIFRPDRYRKRTVQLGRIAIACVSRHARAAESAYKSDEAIKLLIPLVQRLWDVKRYMFGLTRLAATELFVRKKPYKRGMSPALPDNFLYSLLLFSGAQPTFN